MIFQARIHGRPGPYRSWVANFWPGDFIFSVSVWESLVSEFNEDSKYHARYLKMVGTTIALTIIGILIFIQVQKPDASSTNIIENYEMPENIYRLESDVEYANLRKSSPAQLYRSRGFQKRQWEIVGYAKTSKEYELRQHLKQIQLLISDLKYFPQ